jgi:hypothetical protein
MFTALNQNHLPWFSLANYFYRGVLPGEFRDLTWVEEMVCAKYWNTAHVSRIYASPDSDNSQPKFFHGNTCAHEMNVVSTESVLPRTVADITDMITIVFVGAGKFDLNCLLKILKIRKTKVWNFLLWLRKHNHLYNNILLDAKIMDSYPDIDLLPQKVPEFEFTSCPCQYYDLARTLHNTRLHPDHLL